MPPIGKLTLSLAFATSLILQTGAQTTNIGASIEFAKKTIAPINCLVRDAATGNDVVRYQIVGTGFMVDTKGTFITASHVIAALLASPMVTICKPVITFPLGGWSHDKEADVTWFLFDPGTCQVNTSADVAVCRTVNDLSTDQRIKFEVASISKDRPEDGTTIFFTGFPLQATDPITSIGSVAGFTGSDGFNTILIDKNAWPGASGSPIYLSDGKTLVGMVLRTGTGEAVGLSFGVAGGRIMEILANAKSVWAQPNQPTAPAK